MSLTMILQTTNKSASNELQSILFNDDEKNWDTSRTGGSIDVGKSIENLSTIVNLARSKNQI